MKSVTIALSLTVALAAGSAFAQNDAGLPDAGVEIGTLTCHATGITNAILFTQTKLDCVFDAINSDKDENYRGEVREIGVNLSIKNEVTLIWAVFAPTETKYTPGQLDGNYVGVGADASIGVGGGANVLVGGGAMGFQLQPLSIEGIQGAGVSAGIKRFILDAET